MYLVEPLIWRFLPAEFLDLCRIEDNRVTAALLAQAALSLVLADAFATAVLADVALPPVLAMFQKLRVMVDLDVEASKKTPPASFGTSSVLMRRDADRLKL